MRKFLLLMTAAVLLAACGVDEISVPVTQKYERDFIKTFGVIDENQTWRLVEQQSVTVEAEEPSNVKVYVNVGGELYIVADYKNVQGTQTLTYDVPANAQDVKVYVNGIPYGTESRAFIAPEGNGVITRADEYVYYTLGQIKTNIANKKNPEAVLPESEDNRDKDGLKMDYTALVDVAADRADGTEDGFATYSMYPIFWNAVYDHKFGIYYFDEKSNKKVEIDFYENKSGDCMQYYKGKKDKGEFTYTWTNIEDNYVYEWYSNLGNKPGINNLKETDFVLRGRRFDFTLPVGTTFGFYLVVNGNRKYYSNPTLNANDRQAFAYYEADTKITIDEEGNTTDVETNTYICVEDIPVHKEDIGVDAFGQEDAGDMDYNDFIFLLRGKQKHVGESGEDTSTPVEYYYAVEDLGGSYDYDFNDVVFSVSHVSGVDHLHVVPLAAGGVLESFICYHGDGKEYTSNEVHSYFGLSSTGYVNTKDEFTTQPLKGVAFSVPGNWSHTGLGGSDEDATGSTADNGIQVKVIQKDGEVHSIRTPGEGKVPQMLILPKGWEWPTECTRIDEAYPGFGEWGAGYLQGTSWLDTKDEGKVVEHHHVLIAPTVSEDAEH